MTDDQDFYQRLAEWGVGTIAALAGTLASIFWWRVGSAKSDFDDACKAMKTGFDDAFKTLTGQLKEMDERMDREISDLYKALRGSDATISKGMLDIERRFALREDFVKMTEVFNHRLDELVSNQQSNREVLVQEFKQMRERFDAFIRAEYKRPRRD